MHVPLTALAAACVTALTPLSLAQHDAVVSAEQDVKLAFTVPGVVSAAPVKPGDRVQPGQLLLQLDDKVGEAQLDVYRLRAASTLAEDAAEKQWKLAQVEERLVKEALEQGSAGQFEADRAALKAQLASLEHAKARQDRKEAELLLVQAIAGHELRSLRSPIAGTVEEVTIQPGESAEAGRWAVRVVSTSVLRVEVNVPTSETLTLSTDSPAWVRLGSGASAGDLAATITHVALVADARSDTRLVRLSLPNPGDVPAGCAAKVYFSRPPAHR